MLQRAPAIFLNHGGGPMPILYPGEHKPLYESYKAISLLFPPPIAIIVLSAHWIEKEFSILDVDNPGLEYDYYGFPKESYSLKYPASSTKQMRDEIVHQLKTQGLNLVRNTKWKYDHGTFVPLTLFRPKADLPVVQISLKQGFNPGDHYDLGVKLGALRKKGYLILGSGMSYHNMGGFGNPNNFKKSQNFDEALQNIVSKPHTIDQNREAVKNWQKLPNARDCHPRYGEEHLLPLLAIMGAGQGEVPKINTYSLMSVAISDYAFL